MEQLKINMPWDCDLIAAAVMDAVKLNYNGMGDNWYAPATTNPGAVNTAAAADITVQVLNNEAGIGILKQQATLKVWAAINPYNHIELTDFNVYFVEPLKINTELTERLHEKAYLNAYTYYKTGKYKSAIVAFKNALKQYPESKRREEIMYLIVDSGYRLASNSISEKQTDRYLSMLDSYLSFKEEFPESTHIKSLDRMAQQARDYLDRNNKDNNI